jgi:hypothetical protein
MGFRQDKGRLGRLFEASLGLMTLSRTGSGEQPSFFRGLLRERASLLRIAGAVKRKSMIKPDFKEQWANDISGGKESYIYNEPRAIRSI